MRSEKNTAISEFSENQPIPRGSARGNSDYSRDLAAERASIANHDEHVSADERPDMRFQLTKGRGVSFAVAIHQPSLALTLPSSHP